MQHMERGAQRKEAEDVCPRGLTPGRLKAAGMSRSPWNREGREMRPMKEERKLLPLAV